VRPHVRVIAAVAGTVLAAAAATACSGSSSKSASDAGTASPSVAIQEAAKAAPATVTTKSVSQGKILVNDKNLTLYLFQADKSTKSTCTGACAAAWPPLTVKGTPTGSGGVQSTLLSTSKRSDGHPLYRFAGDSKPGQTNGQGLNNFGAKWYVLGTNGKQITSGSSSQAPGGAGY
jgi:predicted lipoprotein with Yx(FWY)xxD motif